MVSKDLQRNLRNIVNEEKRKINYNRNSNKKFLLFINEEPIIDENKEKRIIRSLMDGYFINLLRNKVKKTYVTCFPKKKLSAQFARSFILS